MSALLGERYVLGDRFGRGGMGTVWRAHDVVLDRDVAVKELNVAGLPDEEVAVLQSRMEQEARAAARIKHPGVVTVHDVLQHEGRPWIVMELIDGPSLAEVIASDGPLPPRDVARIGAQVLSALEQAHEAGVVHRDVKPANVLLAEGGRAVLTDFGIAAFEGSARFTRVGDVAGSPDYLAPEQITGQEPGPASDLWSLGATLYTAVEGRPPFGRRTAASTLHAVVSDALPPPRRAGTLGPVVEALLRKDPGARPTADRVRRLLAAVASGSTVVTSRVAATHPPSEVSATEEEDKSGVEEEPALEPTRTIRTTPVRPSPGVRPEAGPPARPPTGAGGAVGGQAVGEGESAGGRRRGRPSGVVVTAAIVALLAGAGLTYEVFNDADPVPTGITELALIVAMAVLLVALHRSGRNRAAVGAVVVLLAAAGGVYAVYQGAYAEDPPPTTAVSTPTPTPTPAPTPTPTPAPTPTPTPTPTSPAPFGYQWVDDPAGFRVAVPDGWPRSVEDPWISYTPDSNRHLLSFAVNPGEGVVPGTHLLNLESTNQSSLTDYRRIALTANTYQGGPGAVWEYTWNSADGPRHAALQSYIAPNGKEYLIYVGYPEVDWPAGRQLFDSALTTFSPQ
ncbi:serine/threonine-protein kinase [Kitasatospora camelliae]|uniref:non-specific serine/threonine protein kinase n=1 Tax=Kitasatospora camelliae TaxID=3156397 RepID=A0AAU8JT67_9ACTN